MEKYNFESPDWLQRTELLIGIEGIKKLNQSHVLVIGLGGVGSFAAEFLVRAGVGTMTIVDGDIIDITNKNRQLPALDSTIGEKKAEVLKSRFLDINPLLNLTTKTSFLDPKDIEALILDNNYDFILDCIDSISPKLNTIKVCRRSKLPFISSMGAGGKINPTKIKISDISKTKECKFAQQIKKRLKRMGIKDGVKVVYSEEIQNRNSLALTDGSNYKKSYYGTISYMPALFGLQQAGYVIQKLLLKE